MEELQTSPDQCWLLYEEKPSCVIIAGCNEAVDLGAAAAVCVLNFEMVVLEAKTQNMNAIDFAGCYNNHD